MSPTDGQEMSMNALSDELDQRHFFFLTGELVHNSRHAATAGQEAVVKTLHQLHPAIEPSKLGQRWQQLGLERTPGTNQARSHSEHVRSWLRALVRGFDVCLNVPEMERLVDAHWKAYTEVLACHAGSRALIDTLIANGKEIIYLSESPFDIQPWLLTELGLHGRSGFVTVMPKGTDDYESLAAEACKASKIWPQEMVLVLDEAAAKMSKAELDRRKRQRTEDKLDRVLVQVPRVSGCGWVSTHRTSRAALATLLLKSGQGRRSPQAAAHDAVGP